MHRLTLILLFLSPLLYAVPHSQRIDSSATNIPTAFAATSDSKLANITSIIGPKILCVDNRSAKEVAVNCSSVANTVPSDTASSNVYVAATNAACFDNPGLKADCYVRSMAGSVISSGIVVVTVFSEK